MSKVIGKVITDCSTESFIFVSTEMYDTKFVCVKVRNDKGEVKYIGEVVEKQTINPYFENPTDIKYISKDDENISKKSLYLSKVRLLSLIQNNHRKEIDFPPLPGLNVYAAEEPDIKLSLSLSSQGLNIGHIKNHNIKFNISIDKLCKTHNAILGQTGSGKSYFAAKLAVELLKVRHYAKVPSQVPIPIIFDSSGEYSGDFEVGPQKELALIMNKLSITDQHFPLMNEKYLPLLYDIYGIDEKQESELRPWFFPEIVSGKRENNSFQQSLYKSIKAAEIISRFHQLRIHSTKQLANTLEEFMQEINMSEKVDKISIPYKVLSRMRKYNLKIKKTDDIDIVDKLSAGLIVDLSKQDNYDERQITMLLFLRQIYDAAKSNKLKYRVVLFIDEAHNYIPSVYKSFCKNEILRLAREGRKYGITLCLISQRPRWVDPTALSQCGNVFIFRIQNSDDKKYIFDSASLPDTIKDINIAKFKTGEMVAVGDIVTHHIICEVTEIDQEFIKLMADKYAKLAFESIKSL